MKVEPGFATALKFFSAHTIDRRIVRRNTAPAGDAGHPPRAGAIERDDQTMLRAQNPRWLADAKEMQANTAKRRVTIAFERVEQFLIPGVSGGVVALDGQTAKAVTWARRSIQGMRQNSRSGRRNW